MRPPRRLVLLGHPVAHSLSPAFQNAALTAAGIALRYEALDVAPTDLQGVLAALDQDDAAGNVTVPHKEAVAARCATLTPLAQRVGAVNTFWHDDGLVGDNTDVGGFDEAARRLLGRPPAGIRVALLGAGGSAAAVLAAVEGWPGSRVRVFNRTAERAETLCTRFPDVAIYAASIADALDEATLVVNATTVGLRDEQCPVGVRELPATAAVLDLVYRRGETQWVRSARAAGHAAMDGLPMLVAQGAIAFSRWFGIEPDRDAMWDAVS